MAGTMEYGSYMVQLRGEITCARSTLPQWDLLTSVVSQIKAEYDIRDHPKMAPAKCSEYWTPPPLHFPLDAPIPHLSAKGIFWLVPNSYN